MTNRTSHRRAITLVELLVVSFILMLVSTIAIVSFRPVIEHAQFESFLNQLKSVDSTTRMTVTGQNRIFLIEFELSDQVVTFTRWNREREYQRSLKVPRQMRIEGVVGGRTWHRNLISIPINNYGVSPTYAVLVTSGKHRRWLLFFGGSGQVREFEDDQQIGELFQRFEILGVNAY